MLRTLVISVPTKSRNSSSRGFKCSVQTLSATSMSLSNTGFKTVSHRLRNTFFVVVIPSFMPSNIGCPHSFQKSEMLCQVSHHSVFKAGVQRRSTRYRRSLLYCQTVRLECSMSACQNPPLGVILQ